MTRYDAIRRQLGDIEKHHERALAKFETQILLLCGYRDQLEDKLDIAADVIADACDCSKDEAVEGIDVAYQVLQAARKVAVT